MTSQRRIVAIVLDQLACELALERQLTRLSSAPLPVPIPPVQRIRHALTSAQAPPLAVVIPEDGTQPNQRSSGQHLDSAPASEAQPRHAAEPPSDTSCIESDDGSSQTPIVALNASARRYGVREGQTVAEARAWVAHLHVERVSILRLERALQRIAECLGRFAPTVALGSPDTIWLDITGVAHLFDGEQALLQELMSTVTELGHSCRLAIASGPHLSRAFARWHPVGRGQVGAIIAPDQIANSVRGLPIQALPIDSTTRAWLAQLGLLQFEDLVRLPAEQLSSRLGSNAGLALKLIAGHDDHPLHAYCPPQLPEESLEWDEPASGSEPLLFALRGLCARISARLEGRGVSAHTLEVVLTHDRTTARFHGVEDELSLCCRLASPLFRADDLWRVISSKLNQTQLAAPSVGVKLRARELVASPQRQLDLMSAHTRLDPSDPEKMQVLFSELAAQIGPERFGTLQLGNSHRPEKLSQLRPIVGGSQRDVVSQREKKHKRRPRPEQIALESAAIRTDRPEHTQTAKRVPTRLLPRPVLLSSPIELGALLTLGGQLFTIVEISFEYRLDSVEWWSGQGICRDYKRLNLHGDSGALEVLVYQNRITGRPFLQAIYD